MGSTDTKFTKPTTDATTDGFRVGRRARVNRPGNRFHDLEGELRWVPGHDEDSPWWHIKFDDKPLNPIDAFHESILILLPEPDAPATPEPDPAQCCRDSRVGKPSVGRITHVTESGEFTVQLPTGKTVTCDVAGLTSALRGETPEPATANCPETPDSSTKPTLDNIHWLSMFTALAAIKDFSLDPAARSLASSAVRINTDWHDIAKKIDLLISASDGKDMRI